MRKWREAKFLITEQKRINRIAQIISQYDFYLIARSIKIQIIKNGNKFLT